MEPNAKAPLVAWPTKDFHGFGVSPNGCSFEKGDCIQTLNRNKPTKAIVSSDNPLYRPYRHQVKGIRIAMNLNSPYLVNMSCLKAIFADMNPIKHLSKITSLIGIV